MHDRWLPAGQLHCSSGTYSKNVYSFYIFWPVLYFFSEYVPTSARVVSRSQLWFVDIVPELDIWKRSPVANIPHLSASKEFISQCGEAIKVLVVCGYGWFGIKNWVFPNFQWEKGMHRLNRIGHYWPFLLSTDQPDMIRDISIRLRNFVGESISTLDRWWCIILTYNSWKIPHWLTFGCEALLLSVHVKAKTRFAGNGDMEKNLGNSIRAKLNLWTIGRTLISLCYAWIHW